MAKPKRSGDRVMINGVWLRKLNSHEMKEFRDAIGKPAPIAILLESDQAQRLFNTSPQSNERRT